MFPELCELTPDYVLSKGLEDVSRQTNLVFIIFNNSYQDYALRNAETMKGLFRNN